MVASPEPNGEWPEFNSDADLPRPEDLHSDREYAQAYATIAVHHGQTYKKVVHALEYLRGHVIGARGEAANAARIGAIVSGEMRLLKEVVQGKAAAQALGLPPMRPELPSTIDAVESIKTKVSGEFAKIARESTGPHVEADPKRLVDVVGKAVDEELARREAARKALANVERLAAIDAAAAQRRKNIRKIVLAGLCAFAAAGGAWAWGKAAGKIEAKAEHPAPAVVAPALSH